MAWPVLPVQEVKFRSLVGSVEEEEEEEEGGGICASECACPETEGRTERARGK